MATINEFAYASFAPKNSFHFAPERRRSVPVVVVVVVVVLVGRGRHLQRLATLQQRARNDVANATAAAARFGRRFIHFNLHSRNKTENNKVESASSRKAQRHFFQGSSLTNGRQQIAFAAHRTRRSSSIRFIVICSSSSSIGVWSEFG